MEISRIRASVRDHAAALGVRDPDVALGRVPSWVPSGLCLRVRRRRHRLIIGPGFNDLDLSAQEAAIAMTMACLAALPRYRRRLCLATGVFFIACCIGGQVTAGQEGWVAQLPLALVLGAWLLAVALLRRQYSYAVDRMAAEKFGWSVIDASVEVHRSKPLQGLNPLRIFTPDVRQRMARLDRLRATAAP
ncbi:MAG TPA: hypothetical protein VFV01_05695 [Spirillospora sp.]|nr:hypothetical protein [Spirillospora sp.]